MNKYIETRKHKEDKPVVAICYDFDKTLSPTDMQAQGFIQSVGYDASRFWDKSNALAENNDMDQNCAYMYTMKETAEGQVLFTRKKLLEYGASVKLFNGVKDWFGRIREYGKSRGVIVEHYIISSGLKEMIEGTPVANEFEKIYASSFYFNDKEVAVWPAQVVNYTNKTQFLFRIQKGTLNINDPGVNDSFSPEDIRVPFRNMVYIGDSDTDIPCMKLVNANGGHSIAVYNPETGDKTRVYKMMREDRIKYYAAADYSEGLELDLLIKSIIDRTASNEKLESAHINQLKEQRKNDASQSEEDRLKNELLTALENSYNYASTHTIVYKMQVIRAWTEQQKEELFNIALNNSQVRGVLLDSDVKSMYCRLLEDSKSLSDNARKIKEIIESTN